LTTGDMTAAVDWTVLELKGVADVAHSAAARVAAQYRHVTEYDDLLQEARLNLAAAAADVRAYLADSGKGLGMLHHRLWCDLVDSVKNDANRRADHLSYEVLRAEQA
jgi:predicted nicotinamide N-methyase